MKLVHRDLERTILLEDQRVCEWIIESPELFSKYVQELFIQSEGGEGAFVLSENDRELSIEKYVEMVVNPFSVNINDKRILNKLYSELKEIALGESMYLKTQEILADLQEYFSELEQYETYFLATDIKVDIADILKAMGVKVESCADNFAQNLDEYIKLVAGLLRKKVFVFVNLGSYISADQIEQLGKTAVYSEVFFLFIENQQRNFSTEFKKYIIDRDNCEI